MHGRTKFVVSSLFALLWLGVSVAISIVWIQGVSQILPTWYVVWVVIGIALLPGYIMSAMFISNILNRRIKKTEYGDAGPVCVIICARNEQDTIYKTIEHIVTQRYGPHIKLICVDNVSTDATWQEMKRAKEVFAGSDRSICLFSCKTPGKSHALNTGLRHVDTKYFITVDADTVLEENAVRTILSRLAGGEVGCVAGNLLAANADTLISKMQIYDYLISIAAVKRYQGSYGATLVAQGAFSAYDTTAVKRLGGWEHGAGEDIVLTYRILSMGLKSLYEPQAIGYTVVPHTFRKLCAQRIRWAHGMFEGISAVKPWQQPSFAGGYFEALNLSIVYLDLSYIFGFLVGVILSVFGLSWFVGLQTLLLFPALFINVLSVYRFQCKIVSNFVTSKPGLICFLFFFQPIQSVCSLIGYSKVLTKRKIVWKQ